MKLRKLLIVLALWLAWSPRPFALADAAHQSKGNMPRSKSGPMEHDQAAATFTHQEVVEGVRAEFQVMSLASMNLKDPEGNTHHVMVRFFDANSKAQIKKAVGKIKVLNPSGKERVESLKAYNGLFTANFTFFEKGNYGVICLFKIDGQKRLVKFWYPHG